MRIVARARTIRRVLLPAATAGLVTVGVVAALPDGQGGTVDASATRPLAGQIHTVALTDITDTVAANERTRRDARPRGRIAGTSATPTKPFSLLGVTWDDGKAPLGGTVRVRVRSAADGSWSAWRPVTADSDGAPDPRSREGGRIRGGTAPLWVGASNGVEVRVAGMGKALPKGLRVDLVDPYTERRAGKRAGKTAQSRKPLRTPGAAGRGQATEMTLMAAGGVAPARAAAEPSTDPSAVPVDSAAPGQIAPPDGGDPSAAPSSGADPSAAPVDGGSPGSGTGTGDGDPADAPAPAPAEPAAPAASAASTAPRPSIISRAGWGADESLVTDPPEYDTAAKAVFVHHTDTGNTYDCAQSASVVRSVFLYHVESNGWNDIGYNFLVDKCGNLFEGRAGGTDKPVHGAHTYGFNTDSAGVAVLGTFVDAAPPQAALDTAAKIAAWKLGLTGADPAGKVTLVSAAPNGTGGKYPFGTSVSFYRVSGHRDGFATACPGELLYGKLGGIRTAAKKWVTPATTASLTGIGGATAVNGTYHTKSSVTVSWQPAAVSGYEVLVDGVVVARPGPYASSQAVTLSAGAHQVQVRANNIDGTTATSPAYAVVADTTAPVFGTPPELSVRTGTVSATSVPVRLAWNVADDRVLWSLNATAPSAKSFTTTTTNWSAFIKPSTSTAWSLSAADAAGNVRTAAVTRRLAGLSESSSTRSSSWKSVSGSSYLGGKAMYSGAKGAYIGWTFTGRSAGLIIKQASNLGAFSVYVDGVKDATVDSKASKTAYRRLVWTKSWSTSGKHTVKIVVAATSGRPNVVTDGLVYLG